MTRQSPAAVLNGVQVGNICDRCNKRVKTGDLVRAYATYYDADGWVVRRVWCDKCSSTTIGLPTDGADEVIVEAVYWSGRLVGAKTVDRSRP
ncbi:hypothetical protein SAMN05216226_105153 [Halovenus aranensis]|uniref:DUF8112 domain-containing protein n=1 Tax=Halovenus aranensis TaxID=890420 RepID=A0A1G8UW64_9EURY|nr:hypothetical protein [Halovenus aranensis]SDJ57874.1 hypothetical protein SAMN05216226_105153 [Halovenus aranensis]